MSNNVLLTLIGAVVITLITVIASGALNASQTSGALVFSIIFIMLGAVAMMKDISIVRCPSRILVGAIGFIALTALIDSYLI